MIKNTRKPFEINKAIRSSAGQRFLDREHSRSFSLNIFRANTRELIEALRHVSDPENGLHLMAISNKEEGTQAHREVNRRIHNFVAASKTLVDQTRAFIKENYNNTYIWNNYNSEVEKRFSKNNVTKFVHDLRNYMLHKALPNSIMFINYYQDPNKPDQGWRLTTGVKLDAKALSDWDGWTEPARAYLLSIGDEVSIEEFTSAYVSQVEEFQTWINNQLNEFHAADIAELEALHEEYADVEREIEKQKKVKLIEEFQLNSTDVIVDPYEISFTIRAEIDNLANELSAGIRKIDLASDKPADFMSERPVGTIITTDKLVEDPILWREDSQGDQVLVFISRQSGAYGFDKISLPIFEKTKKLITSIDWVKQKIGDKTLEKIIIEWCRASFGHNNDISLSEAITTAGRTQVMTVDVWVPIEHLEIECGFSFGTVDIKPITAQMINNLEAVGLEYAPGQEVDIRTFFNKLRNTIQGYAAVVVRLEASNEIAGKIGLYLAQETIDLLRFFSPAASDASLISVVSLLGSLTVPKSNLLVLGNGTFSYTEGLIQNGVVYWYLSKQKLTEMEDYFSVTARLIGLENLNDFERAVRSCIIMIGKAATFCEPHDRLSYTLSAMERLLLKHELEATAYSVEDRMSRLLMSDNISKNQISQNVRAAYRLRNSHKLTQWSAFDNEVLYNIVISAYNVSLISLGNTHIFSTREEFIEAIELKK